MSPSKIRKHVKVELKVEPYLPAFIQELIDVNLNRKRNACAKVIQAFSTIPKRGKVIFSDECAVYRSSQSGNVVFWSKEKLNYFEELERSPPHFVI